MYAGRLIEQAEAADLYRSPRHPYTLGLLNSFPSLHGPRERLTGIPGSPPDLRNPPAACAFHPRCGYAMDVCRAQVPETLTLSPGNRTTACWLQASGHVPPPELSVTRSEVTEKAARGRHAAQPSTAAAGTAGGQS